MKTPEGRCVSIYWPSNVIIMENMDVYEVFTPDDSTYAGISQESHKGLYHIRKLPMKANINFEEYYGDDGKANWSLDHLPVVLENNLLIWDY
jgi:hypothetical protein